MKKSVKVAVALTAVAAIAHSTSVAQTAGEVPPKYKSRVEALKSKGEALKRTERPSALGATVGIDCKTKFGLQSVNVPIPEVTMNLQEIILHVPEFKWAETRIGPIVMHLPQTWMGEQRIKLHLPEFKIGNLEIKLHLPEVTCGDPRISIQQTSREGKQLAEDARTLSAEMKADLIEKHSGPLQQKKREALSHIDGAVKGLQAMVEHVRASHGDVSTLAAKLKELEDQRAKVARQFDDAIKQLGL